MEIKVKNRFAFDQVVFWFVFPLKDENSFSECSKFLVIHKGPDIFVSGYQTPSGLSRVQAM